MGSKDFYNDQERPLTTQELNALTLIVMQGKSIKDAKTATGLTMSHIERLLKRPDIVKIQQQVHLEFENSVARMWPLVEEAHRDGLTSDNEYIKQQSIDKFYKVQGKYKPTDATRQSATEVARELLALYRSLKDAGVDLEKIGPGEMDLFREDEDESEKGKLH